MKAKLLALAVAISSLAGSVQAAISIGPNGTGTFTFDDGSVTNLSSGWSTHSVGTASGTIMDAAGLDAAVQLLDASAVNTPLGFSATTAPPSANGLARWNSVNHYIQTRPTGVDYLVLMATLQNDSGSDISSLFITYTLGLEVATGLTLGEEVPGHRVYYSPTGAPGSWQLITSLTTSNAASLSAKLELGSWPVGATLYLLWADDNGTGGTGTTGTQEGAYTIDNFTAISAASVISVGPSGTGGLTLDTWPPVSQWSTHSIGTSSATIVDAAGLDSAVQLLDASTVITALGASATVNPPSVSAVARWNSVNHYLQTRPTGNDYLVLMATLRNDTGGDVSSLTVTYDLGAETAAGSTIVEEVPGHRVYYSQTGAPGSWTVIPAFSSVGTPGTLSAHLDLGTWPSGGLLHVLWADDNATANVDGLNNEEGAYTLDNFSFGPGTTSFVTINSPTNGQVFVQGAPIPISASAVLPSTVTDVAFYENGNLIGSDGTSPFSVIYSNATLGAHSLTAVATDNLANTITSSTVEITVVPNSPPSVTLTNPATGTSVLVGSNVVHNAIASDTDGSVLRVEFYVDGELRFSDTTSPYSFELCDVLAGAHLVSAVAVDNAGGRETNSISITATNPPDITVLIPNGSIWKYLDDGSDQDVVWRIPGFDDSSWSEGAGELGYGDAANNRPERTLVSFGPDPNAKHPTTYFRKTITVPDPTIFTNLVLQLLRDDSGIVYINDFEVFRSGLTNETVNFSTYTQPGITDDGTVYQVANLAPTVLNAGFNTIAVEIHQDATNSSDISFDLMLWGQGAPRLDIALVPQGDGTDWINLTWSAASAVLQTSDHVDGPWDDVPGATSPVLTKPLGAGKFYRLRTGP